MKKALLAVVLGLSVLACPLLYIFVGPALDAAQISVLKTLLIICACSAAYCFVVGEITCNNSQMDKLWSILPEIYIWVIAARSGFSPRLVIMAVIATLWGIRLTANFALKGAYSIKFWAGEEDYRWIYLRSRKEFQPRWKWAIFDLFFISTYQNVLVLMTTFPALVAMGSDKPLGWIDCLAAVLMLGFVIYEMTADIQQWKFQSAKWGMIKEGRKLEELPAPYNKGFNTTGLWKFSRHPNYFAEQGTWVALYIFSIAAGVGILNWSIIGALLLIVLFLGSSAFAEEISSSKYPEYARYIREVSRFFPGKPYKGSMLTIAALATLIGSICSCSKETFTIDDPLVTGLGCINMRVGDIYVVQCSDDPKTAQWSSSNPDVADAVGGVIFAYSPGTATISVAPKSGKKVTFKAIVEAIPAASFDIDETISLYCCSSSYIEVSNIVPETATAASIAWESSDESVFTLSQEGNSIKINGISQGTATLTGRAESVTRTSTVTVKGPEKLILPSMVEAYVNHDVEVSVVQEPEVYTDYNWSIRQDGNICNLRSEGAKAVLTGVAIGQCTLELTLAGGSIKKSCEVNVKNGSLVLDKSESTLIAGDELTLTATQYPVQYSDYEWVSEDASVATVSGSGNTAVVRAGNKTGETVIKCYINGRATSASCRISTFGPDYLDKLGVVLMRPTKGPNFVGDKVYISPTRTSDAELRILTIYKTDLPECFKGRIRWSTGTQSEDSFSTVIKNQTSYRELTITCSTPLGDMRLNYIQGFKALEVREFVYYSFPKVAIYGNRPGWYRDGNYSHWFDAVYRTLPSKTAELTPEGWANWNIKPNSSFFVTGVDDYGESIGIIQNGYRTSANADGIHTRTDYIHVYYRDQQITDYKNGTWFETDDVTTSKTVDGTVSINNQSFRIHCSIRP